MSKSNVECISVTQNCSWTYKRCITRFYEDVFLSDVDFSVLHNAWPWPTWGQITKNLKIIMFL